MELLWNDLAKNSMESEEMANVEAKKETAD